MDVLNQVDVLLKDKKGNSLLYIEAKFQISNEALHKQALAQTILTNKKQIAILDKVALIYQDSQSNDVLELIDCSDNSVMYNNDINWGAEKASSPTKDAIDRINDRIKGKITVYKNEEIKEFYNLLKQNKDTAINITETNFNVIYNQWKSEIKFKETIADEQDLINLFFVDILNGTTYKKQIEDDLGYEREQELIREGTHLSNYRIMYSDGKIDGIKYSGKQDSAYYTISDAEHYSVFWRKYKRPPEKHEFLKILERSATLYSEKYRKDTGGEYTPSCFVELQNKILAEHYNINDFIVCDPCAGVGNLENQFGKDFKQYCYLSTLEQMDVDICKIKGFENAIQYDYLKDDLQPKWKYKGSMLDINEIAKREGRKLMVIMNPPYQRVKGKKNNLAIEFFNKVLALKPQVIVFYYGMESFFRDEVMSYTKSGYKILSHVFSDAKTTFHLSNWPISQIIFDVAQGTEISIDSFKADRYELENDKLVYQKSYAYNNSRPYLIKEIDCRLKNLQTGLILGQYSYLSNVLVIGNGGAEKKTKITTDNLKYALLSKGINFNSHAKYFERNYHCYRGKIEDIPTELFCDSVMFSLFYKNNQFSNKGYKNYIMPFTAEELGCPRNELNVLYPQDKNCDLFAAAVQEEPFDFRKFLTQFQFSKEAKDLYYAALEIFRFYHKNEEYSGKNWNDSFYDITNTIMGKDISAFGELDPQNDTRINKTKTTKGTKGFGRNTIKYAVSSQVLPIFIDFFDKRDILAKKINRQLVEHGLLLWERENIY